MLFLSIDVGMKNLAYCIIDYNEEIEIKHWGIINLCNDKKYICNGKSKNKACNKNGKYINKDFKCYCKIHAKDKGLCIPTKEYNKDSIKKFNGFGEKVLEKSYAGESFQFQRKD